MNTEKTITDTYEQVATLLKSSGYTERDMPRVLAAMAKMSLDDFIGNDVAEQLKANPGRIQTLTFINARSKNTIGQYEWWLKHLNYALSAFRVVTCLEAAQPGIDDITALRDAGLFGDELIAAEQWVQIVDYNDGVRVRLSQTEGDMKTPMAEAFATFGLWYRYIHTEEINRSMRERIYEAASRYRRFDDLEVIQSE